MTMTVLKTSIIFANRWMATRLDAAAACPTVEGDDPDEVGQGLG